MSGRLLAFFRLRAFCIAGALPLAFGCSHMSRFALGPAVAYPDDGDASYGGELRVRTGAGSSDEKSATFLEVGGRLLVTERTQALGVGMGPAYLHWLGPSAITASLTPGLGVEHFQQKPFMNFSLNGSLGTGLVLEERVRGDRPWAITPEAVGLPDGTILLRRDRVVLTLDVTGSIDARTTRQPLYGIGILIGVAKIGERYSIEAPQPAHPADGFRFQ
jgi:hypothetical protein